jgi:hypothetical protein
MAAVCKTMEPARTKDKKNARAREREREREREEKRQRETETNEKETREKGEGGTRDKKFHRPNKQAQRPYSSNQSLALFASQA